MKHLEIDINSSDVKEVACFAINNIRHDWQCTMFGLIHNSEPKGILGKWIGCTCGAEYMYDKCKNIINKISEAKYKS